MVCSLEQEQQVVPTDQKYSLKESLASIVVCWNVSALSVFLLENLLPLFLIGVI